MEMMRIIGTEWGINWREDKEEIDKTYRLEDTIPCRDPSTENVSQLLEG